MKIQTLSAASFVLVASLFSTIPSFAQTTTHTKHSLVTINKAKSHVAKPISTLHFPTNKTNKLTPAQMNQANRELNAITPTTNLKQKPQYTFTVKDKTLVKTFAVYSAKKEKYVYLIGYVPVSTKPITKPKPKIQPKPNPYAGMYYVPYPSNGQQFNYEADETYGDTYYGQSGKSASVQHAQTLAYMAPFTITASTPPGNGNGNLDPISNQIAIAPYGISYPVYQDISQVKYMPNVIFVNPNDMTSIQNYQAVWSKIQSTPVVVWTDATVQSAPEIWKQDGFSGNPLPTWYNAYAVQMDGIQGPEGAYHWDGKQWLVLPWGSLVPQNQVQALTTFFNYVAPGKITPPPFQYTAHWGDITKNTFAEPYPNWPPLVNGQLTTNANATSTSTNTTSS